MQTRVARIKYFSFELGFQYASSQSCREKEKGARDGGAPFRTTIYEQLGGRVFDVFAGALLGILGFGFGVGVGLQGVNGLAEAEGLAAFRSGAGGDTTGCRLRG